MGPKDPDEVRNPAIYIFITSSVSSADSFPSRGSLYDMFSSLLCHSVCLLRKQDKVFLKWDPTHFTLLRRDENFTGGANEVEESECCFKVRTPERRPYRVNILNRMSVGTALCRPYIITEPAPAGAGFKVRSNQRSLPAEG